MNFENLDKVLTLSNKGKSSFNNIDKGTYDIYLNGKDESFLFTMIDNNKILKYSLNYFASKQIKNIISKHKNKIPRFTKIQINNKNYKDYNLKLICKKEDNKNKIYIQITDKEPELIYEDSIIEKIQPNTTFDIIDFHKTKYGGIVTASNGLKYWINKKAMDRIRKYCKIVNDEIQCKYNEKVVNPKLTFEAGEEYEFEKKDKDEKLTTIKSCYQSFKLTIDNESHRFFVNKPYDIDYKHENEYKFLLIYIDYIIIGYDIIHDKYFKLPDNEVKLVLSKVDKQFKDDYNRDKNIDTYSYIIHNNHRFILKLNYKKNEAGIMCKEVVPLKLTKLPKGILDITKLEKYDVIDESDVPVGHVGSYADAPMIDDEEIGEVNVIDGEMTID